MDSLPAESQGLAQAWPKTQTLHIVVSKLLFIEGIGNAMKEVRKILRISQRNSVEFKEL